MGRVVATMIEACACCGRRDGTIIERGPYCSQCSADDRWESGGGDLDLDAPPASAFVFGDPVFPSPAADPWPR